MTILYNLTARTARHESTKNRQESSIEGLEAERGDGLRSLVADRLADPAHELDAALGGPPRLQNQCRQELPVAAHFRAAALARWGWRGSASTNPATASTARRSHEDVGRTESHGCFRLANWNVEQLLKMVAVGTPIVVER